MKEEYVSAWDIINTVIIKNKSQLLLMPPGQQTIHVITKYNVPFYTCLTNSEKINENQVLHKNKRVQSIADATFWEHSYMA